VPYDEGLAQRIREQLEDRPGLTEKRMFGGIAFLVHGKMAVGIVRDDLMVRVGPDRYEAALAESHVREMDFTGRPMRGMIYVTPEGLAEDDDLRRWLGWGVAYATSQAEAGAPKRVVRARRAPKRRKRPAPKK